VGRGDVVLVAAESYADWDQMNPLWIILRSDS